MEPKKTLTNWLTNRYLIIIRDEENFAEKKTYGFTYAKLIVMGISIILISLVFSYYIITGFLSTWLDPREKEADSNRKIIILSARVDSLAMEVSRKDNYIHTLKDIISGKNPVNSISSKVVKRNSIDIEEKESILAGYNKIKTNNN